MTAMLRAPMASGQVIQQRGLASPGSPRTTSTRLPPARTASVS
jgi:hypothetical protein